MWGCRRLKIIFFYSDSRWAKPTFKFQNNPGCGGLHGLKRQAVREVGVFARIKCLSRTRFYRYEIFKEGRKRGVAGRRGWAVTTPTPKKPIYGRTPLPLSLFVLSYWWAQPTLLDLLAIYFATSITIIEMSLTTILTVSKTSLLLCISYE